MASAQTVNSNRHANDLYATPDFFTNLLVDVLMRDNFRFSNEGSTLYFLEPYAGPEQKIANALRNKLSCKVLTNDILPGCLGNIDLSIIENYKRLPWVHGVVTNGPYNLLNDINHVIQLYDRAIDMMALLVRQTWLTAGGSGEGKAYLRAQWLERHPPSKVMVLPRYNWTDNKTTGKPQSDACAHYWVIWDKWGDWRPDKPYEVFPKDGVPGFQQRTESFTQGMMQ